MFFLSSIVMIYLQQFQDEILILFQGAGLSFYKLNKS